MKSWLLLLLPLLICFMSGAQSVSSFGIMPSVNINHKFHYNWSVNLKAESRQFISGEKPYYDYALTDISVALARKVAPNVSAAVGFLMRIDEKEIKNRTIQQISVVRKYSRFRISHRLMTDQTFAERADTELRLRYRFSAEIPLQGDVVNEKEFYLKLSNEYLNSWQAGDYDLEIRGAGFLGYFLTARSDLEIGVDYRTDSFIHNRQRNRIFLSVNFFQSLGNK